MSCSTLSAVAIEATCVKSTPAELVSVPFGSGSLLAALVDGSMSSEVVL
jgi:hypothetical protein